jgi:uncharacterized protein (DUF427 family)
MTATDRQSGYGDRFDYRVDILRRRNLVSATRSGAVLAQSTRALLIDEQNHGLVFYFPREDVRLELLAPMPEKSSFCPYKGEASYWRQAGETGEAIAWSYERPYPEVAQIREYVAFYQDRVTVSVGTAEALRAAPGANPG